MGMRVAITRDNGDDDDDDDDEEMMMTMIMIMMMLATYTGATRDDHFCRPE